MSMSALGHMQNPPLQKASSGSADIFLQSDVFTHGINGSAIESIVLENEIKKLSKTEK